MEYELYHYGVPGMRWGVRKAGSVSSASKYVIGGEYSDRRKKRMTKEAVKILNRNFKESTALGGDYAKRAKNLWSKAGDKMERAMREGAAGNLKKAAKYEAKSTKLVAKYQKNQAKAQYWLQKSFDSALRLEGIKSGQLEAGRDFVTNARASTSIPLSLLGVWNMRVEKRVDFRDGV